MKISSKILAGVFAAAVMASAAVSVSATDYPSNPNYPETATPAEEVTAADITAAVEAAADEDVVTITLEEDAGAKLDAAAIAAIKASEKPIEFKNAEYSVIIDPSTITGDVTEIDLSMAIEETDEETEVDGVSVPAGAVVIVPATSGEFGMTVTVTVKTELTDANLYYISDEGEVENLGEAAIDDGVASITISHASIYVLSADPIGGGEGDGDDNNAGTGVTLPIALVALAGGSVAVSAIVAKKRK